MHFIVSNIRICVSNYCCYAIQPKTRVLPKVLLIFTATWNQINVKSVRIHVTLKPIKAKYSLVRSPGWQFGCTNNWRNGSTWYEHSCCSGCDIWLSGNRPTMIDIPFSKLIVESLDISNVSRLWAICSNPFKWCVIRDLHAVQIWVNALAAAAANPFFWFNEYNRKLRIASSDSGWLSIHSHSSPSSMMDV